jgi:hypothetical protein
MADAGVEVVTGSHTSQEAVTYAGMAREFGLAASRGSDFHSPDESRTDLGTLPPACGTHARLGPAGGPHPVNAGRVGPNAGVRLSNRSPLAT